MSVLVVGATEAEVRHVPAAMRVIVTGVGKVAAAVATTRALLEQRPDVVVNVGSAGALREGLTGVIEVGTVLNHDISAAAVRSLGLDPRDELRIGPAPAVLATGDVFVSDPALRSRLARRAHLVDMEGYAVAFAATALGVPVRLVKHVSDNADESALDWVRAVEVSARALGAWLEERHS